MVEEHKNIKRMLAVVRKMCLRVLEGQPLDYDDFHLVIDFVRNYADNHHHGKEEVLLFDRMEKELGPVAQTLIRHGMLVEHNSGRLFIQELEDALKRVQNHEEESKLDLIANAVTIRI
jgi:hemerythrin-like domain-containing protein